MRLITLCSIIFPILLSLVRKSFCSNLKFAEIGRNLSGTWQNTDANSAASFDQRISDLIASHVLRFAHDLGQKLIEESNGSKYEVFSPVSITSALAMLMLGARGRSYQQLQHVLGLDFDAELIREPSKFHTELGYLLEDLQKHGTHGLSRSRQNAEWRNTRPRYDLRLPRRGNVQHWEHITKVANGIFTQIGYSLNPDYQYVLKSVYQSALEALDFAKSAEARDYINRWVDRHTLGKIPDLIKGELSPSSKVALASALYFKGFWENTFIDTIEEDFYPDGLQRPPVKAQMMLNSGSFPYYESAEYDCRIIGLPYKDNLTTMYVILPNQSSRSKIRDLQLALDAPTIEYLISQMVKRTVGMSLPKMHLVSTIKLKSTLNHLGVEDIFNYGVSDLSLIGSSGVSTRDDYVRPLLGREILNKLHLDNIENDRVKGSFPKSDLYVDEVIHQVDVDVNEQGTEAAAATVALVMKTGPEVFFHANTPFLFLIRHDPTKLALFYGIVNEPQ